MKIQVQLRPNAKHEKIEAVSESVYRVWVTAPARDGRANEMLIVLLARHFGRPKRAVRLAKGAASRRKLIEIL